MRQYFSALYIVALSLYILSHIVDVPEIGSEIRGYAETLVLYFFLASFAILSFSNIFSKWFKKERKTASETISENLKAHVFTTRIIVFIVVVGFPLFLYFNHSKDWGVSDAVVVAIPTILLAIVIAEQNVYTYLANRLERTGIEQARVAAVYQIVDTMLKDPTRKGIPEQYDIEELEHRLRLWEDRTAEANFAKFASQAIITLRSIKRNNATAVWDQFLDRVHTDLGEFVDSFT